MTERSSVAELAAILRAELNRYSPHEKLPSSRALVERHQVSPVTVSRAIAALVAEGLVVSRPGAGVFRAERRAAPAQPGDVSWQELALSAETFGGQDRRTDASGVLGALTMQPADVLDLNSGYLHPSLQPERALAAALARAGRRPGAWGRPPVEGLPELRAWFAREIGGPDGTLSASDVLITAGGQGALSTALRSLVAPGAPVLVESPSYPGTLAVARAAGLRPVPVPVDQDGVRTELLAEAFAATRARAFVCQPLFHNPTGAVLSAERRREVLRIARAAGAFVVEDDFARLLVHADAPAPAPALAAEDPDGVVVHVRSLTKATSPSLRVGGLTARGPAFERLRAMQAVDSFFVSRPLQETALELVGSPAWARQLRDISAALAERRRAAVDTLARLRPELLGERISPGGYHLWLRLADGTDDRELAAAARRNGVAVTPGRPYFAAEPPAPHLRLSYAASRNLADLTEGITRLARTMDDQPAPGAP
ncbi:MULTISPECIES: PLP-dependent aminotransferase family protein [unclassified Kitasatospora]|uniref:aminotransferase-like domain-containing protein n=1 Tax=unclassified Kitasatospora TaxID=2633591 RepID=UPI000709380F|nr:MULTISPECIES: PLP-dependent aminotransferase family protein [unclassified Kitasatospora]KQV04474.1 GntR family transcriptional regulator [Kitasatospora sp. Root107]KRB60995.1 GntR family transcriptional regulator [Kitasatospora sp. Root187]